MEPKEVVKDLCKHLGKGWDKVAWKSYNEGDYEIHVGEPLPSEYDEDYSSICWGWLTSSDQTRPVVATYSHGERGNEAFGLEGLHVWYQSDAEADNNAQIERAAKALASKRMGFAEFKAIVRQYT
jgi:hypothetical protein